MQRYFTFWVALSLSWTLVALVAAAVLPLLESGPITASMLKWMLGGLCSKPDQQEFTVTPGVTKKSIDDSGSENTRGSMHDSASES